MPDLIIGNKNYSSWSLRPWVLMHMLGMAFDEHLYPFGEAFASTAFLQASPTRRVPVLRIDGMTVWDSLAIVETLAEREPRVWPADARARAWARSAAAEMHSGFTTLRQVCAMNCGVRIDLRDRSVALIGDLARIAEIWEEGLDRFGGPYLAGEHFTAVDAFFAPVAFRLQTYGLSTGDRGDAYAQRLLALPAMRSWYEQALAEPWRDGSHEADCWASGRVTADYRAGQSAVQPGQS